jgi:hypothetical protein
MTSQEIREKQAVYRHVSNEGGRPRQHRAQFTSALLEALPLEWIEPGPVLDPFAGLGIRLGAWCNKHGIPFHGFDIEPWPGRDPRVLQADATKADCYPASQHIIVTSPTYGSGMNDHFSPKNPNRRDNTYRTWLGEDLHPNNSGRYTSRHGGEKERRYWEINEAAVASWAARGFDAIVNVKTSFPVSKKMLDRFPSGDYPLAAMWRELLERHGYAIADTIEVATPGLRYGRNTETVAESEVWLHAVRETTPWPAVGSSSSTAGASPPRPSPPAWTP